MKSASRSSTFAQVTTILDNAVAAASKRPLRVILATPTDSATFTLNDDGTKVTVVTLRQTARGGRSIFEKETLPIEAARKLYRRLEAEGFGPW
jgi:hypothetical protein